MNRSQAIFSKGRINSACGKMMICLSFCFLFSSCNNEKFYKNRIVGTWTYQGIYKEKLNGLEKLNEENKTNLEWHEYFSDVQSLIFTEFQTFPKFENIKEFQEIGTTMQLNMEGDTIAWHEYEIIGNELNTFILDDDYAKLGFEEFEIVKIKNQELIIKSLKPTENDDSVMIFKN
ncbi:hypothetical protein DDD_3358 [Nonlabens dokdonensis DSW-6]|uniref:Lipocalin-like domain-containing protein n=2 Tax=Nonlabens dokdonensis TaxID=328515 RepID=L7W9Y0_NONDD|nr:hypothetical protein DDD_3358 [Nonlabens dokdonensis DSW-6]